MLKIRLRRQGAKKQPTYRIVVAEADFKRDGRFLEIIGNYNPRTEPASYELQEDRALHYLKNGAQPSDAVRRIMTWSGTLERLARLRQGEDFDALVAEGEAAAAERTFDPRTRRDDLFEERKAQKKAKAKDESSDG